MAEKEVVIVLKTFASSLQHNHQVKKRKNATTEDLLAAQDSVVQRFETSYEFFWKLTNRFLKEKYGIDDLEKPKQVFTKAVEKRLCSSDEGDTLLSMLVDRNITVHEYDLEKVRAIVPRVPNYYKLMVDVAERINKSAH